MSQIPADLKYTVSHEWIRLEGDTAVIGITDHAQEALGDVVYIELPEIGRVLRADDVFGSVESVKAVSELYAPLAGEVVDVNKALEGNESAINDAPYEGAWMIKVRLADPAEASALLDSEAYRQAIGE
ncbi:MAG: glycine cleavage system protein GcvH [Armatimonadota bacterium]